MSEQSATLAGRLECAVLRAGAPFIGKQGFSYAPAVSAETVGASAEGRPIAAWLSGKASAEMINTMIDSTRHRPHPWSTFSDYTSWPGLSDRTFCPG